MNTLNNEEQGALTELDNLMAIQIAGEVANLDTFSREDLLKYAATTRVHLTHTSALLVSSAGIMDYLVSQNEVIIESISKVIDRKSMQKLNDGKGAGIGKMLSIIKHLATKKIG